jgi:hypothetical protein
MLPAAGILLTERLYIGLYIVQVSDEEYSEYATRNNGTLIVKILDGRGKLFDIELDGKQYRSVSRNTNITFNTLNGGTDYDWSADVDAVGFSYTLTLTDRAKLALRDHYLSQETVNEFKKSRTKNKFNLEEARSVKASDKPRFVKVAS